MDLFNRGTEGEAFFRADIYLNIDPGLIKTPLTYLPNNIRPKSRHQMHMFFFSFHGFLHSLACHSETRTTGYVRGSRGMRHTGIGRVNQIRSRGLAMPGPGQSRPASLGHTDSFNTSLQGGVPTVGLS